VEQLLGNAGNAGADIGPLVEFCTSHRRLFVLTGAGVSTASGISDYRDHRGEWKQQPPMDYRDFMGSAAMRQRYWARGHVSCLVTQNVDDLHRRAGHQHVVDLHGRLASVVCMDCGSRFARAAVQMQLVLRNPDYQHVTAPYAPDGDAHLPDREFSEFAVPACASCGGVLKPDVVFYGENVPGERVAEAYAALASADAVLVIGSSLMIFSGYRFVRRAVEQGKRVAAINLGRTRADGELHLKVVAPCIPVLRELRTALG
jgi:NAD-dependent SIR2 family protein deacetylase